MSQRLNAGFNWPRLSVGAGEPDKLTCRPRRLLTGVFSSVEAPSLWSRPVGVAQLVSAKSCKFEPWRVSPIARFSCPPLSASCSVGVGQLASGLS
jgi:hypothetical protein